MKGEKMSANRKQKLSRKAKKLYNQVVEYLKKIDKYAEIDQSIITLFADTYDLYLKNKKIVDEEGAVLTRQNGNKYLHPAYIVMQQAVKSMKSLAGALGIGAEARNKLGIEDTGEDDEFIRFMREWDDD